MAAGEQTKGQSTGWNGPSRRRVRRYFVQAPLDVTVLRSGIPDTVPGRSVNLCERGVAAVLAGELLPGEAVGVEMRLPLATSPLRMRALIRHQDKLRCGMEFIGLSPAQQTAIRQWTVDASAEIEEVATKEAANKNDAVVAASSPVRTGGSGGPSSGGPGAPSSGRARTPGKNLRGLWTIPLLVAAILIAVFWLRWNRGWHELESGLPSGDFTAAGQPRAHVPPEVMERLLVHKVDPDYPAAARPSKLRGVIVLNIEVARDGTVVNIRPLSGPDILARAAMDAVRWWRYDPYRINGESTAVETTVAVEFNP